MFPLFGGIGGMANPFGYSMSPMLGQLGLLAMMRQRMEQGDAQQQPSFEQQPVAPVEALDPNSLTPGLDQMSPDPQPLKVSDISTNGQQRMVVNGTLNLSPEKGGIATLNPISAEPLPQPGFITPRPGGNNLLQAFPAIEPFPLISGALRQNLNRG
jgi:hypothetical protein